MGAWIETAEWLIRTGKQQSHPTWVRGLKQLQDKDGEYSKESHPTWVRGLKLHHGCNIVCSKKVAPYVGAWIETHASFTVREKPDCRTLRGCVD